MKKLHIAGNLLKGVLLAGMLTACQNEDVLNPKSQESGIRNEAEAKVNAELRLVEDGYNKLKYIKAGRLAGKLSKISGSTLYTEYSYDDSTGDLWITSKQYYKANNQLCKEIAYQIKYGKCVKSIDKTNNITREYKYNEMGYLQEVSIIGSALSQKSIFTYQQIALGLDSKRLDYITSYNSFGAPYERINFFYDYNGSPAKADKYFLNPEHTSLDPYLPYFGKFSDALVQRVQITPLPYNGQTKPFYQFFYGINADGYASSRHREFYPLGYGNEAGKQAFYSSLTYSTNWAGL
ncbi:hypothetical protein [Dyadobacter fermentans]|uniref:DUF4595 domain-containing protein n=1 Tax=Dyadobacter fermentans (strain ATCC 700827 / DSM 18053 / CIP 107007 / KCTC 52180 / NS114) TaxID=471854 RepID=C6W305_DYAFD|nr:hypothetical protein [Dyadobacter fermentans]ACT95718.1 hypothetical protein Dfer_4517 [Dyadobacter fermentans DSM 18053]